MQVEHKTEKGTVLFVKVPDDAIGIYLTNTIEYGNCLTYKWNDEPCLLRLSIDGDWQLIGLTSEISEEQANMMVDESKGWFLKYKNYLNREFEYFSALDSFKSLMQYLQVYDVNTLDKPKEEKTVGMVNVMDFWKYAESRSGKCLVLFKPEI